MVISHLPLALGLCSRNYLERDKFVLTVNELNLKKNANYDLDILISISLNDHDEDLEVLLELLRTIF